jgi:hypothetical protein
MRKNEADVLRDLRGELNPDPRTRAHGDVYRDLRGARSDPGSRSIAQAPEISDADLPYDPKVGVLPQAELTRLLRKHMTSMSGPKGGRDALFSAKEIAELSHSDEAYVGRLKYNFVSEKRTVSIPARKRISQTLLRIEAGLIVKRNGVVEKRTAAEAKPLPPTIQRRVLFSPSGRVTIVQGAQSPKARPFPKMLGDWVL